ncbi:ABC transporter permease [Pseudolysinimonas kribbensis]|uniref:Transport permease protein n=1 Tax=Pseudolysinimonas kribbensis TaxID=433641 RepID=A0ABQ6K170_9MICO|nr:ABC transporter permease [Pseudolysinimonas kribbensis]GMA94347.1 transport permease protein [Pseudolysinimonas kribbensis]
MTSTSTRPAIAPTRRRGGVGALYSGNARAVVYRGLRATGSTNYIVVATGFVEPVFYLLALGVGLGSFVGPVSYGGIHIPYAAYIAPALLGVSAMNGAIYDSTWNVFFKMHFARLYHGMLATSLGPLDVALGEILLALLRGGAYAVAFLIVMSALGLSLSWTVLLALPAVLLIAFGFASLGMGITSYLKTFQQMDWINFALLPMFLLSATFYPLSVYPVPLQWVIEVFPLWHAVELLRGLTTGILSPAVFIHVGYFLVMIAVGLTFTTRRLRALFLD